jgi:hypothetical protein
MMEGTRSESVQKMMDPDPGDSKTYGSYGSGSTTLLMVIGRVGCDCVFVTVIIYTPVRFSLTTSLSLFQTSIACLNVFTSFCTVLTIVSKDE